MQFLSAILVLASCTRMLMLLAPYQSHIRIPHAPLGAEPHPAERVFSHLWSETEPQPLSACVQRRVAPPHGRQMFALRPLEANELGSVPNVQGQTLQAVGGANDQDLAT